MHLKATAIDLHHAERVDVVVDAAPDVSVGSLAAALARLTRGPAPRGAPPVVYVDRRPLDPRMPLRHTPIRDGAMVSLDDPAGCPAPEPPGIVEVRVTGGPAAGTVVQLRPGDVVVGSGHRAGVRIADGCSCRV
jgi:DNA segregation ATPase FtsK/SpoIIIE, S-DNA-T family